MFTLPFAYQLCHGYGPNSESRINFINDWFDKIMKYWVPDDFKICFLLNKNLTPEMHEAIIEWYKSSKLKRNEIQNKMNMHDLLRAYSEPENQDIYLAELEFFKLIRPALNQLGVWIRQLSQIKFKLNTIMKDLGEWFDKGIESFSVEILKKWVTVFNKLRIDKYLNRNEIWDIPDDYGQYDMDVS